MPIKTSNVRPPAPQVSQCKTFWTPATYDGIGIVIVRKLVKICISLLLFSGAYFTSDVWDDFIGFSVSPAIVDLIFSF
jgi:hypothetical protein